MPLLDVMLGGLVLIAGISSRIQAGRLARRATDDTDEVYHRAYTQVLRQCGHRLPPRFPQFVGPGRNTYPAGYHWALSFLPQRASDAIGRNGGLVGDVLLGGAVSALLIVDADMPVAAGIAVLGLYLLSPAMMLVNLGPRSFHLTPRLPSQLLYGTVAVIAIASDGDVTAGPAVLITVLVALNLLISKFAVQATVLALPVLAVAAGPLLVLGIFIAACALATALSRGFFLRQVRGQAEHLEWYVKRQRQYMFRAMAWRSLLGAIRRGDALEASRIVVSKNSLTAGLVRHVHVVAAGIWLLVERPSLTGAQSAALAFTVAGAFGWLATSGGVLRVIGEAERYLEFAFPASWFLFWSLPDGLGLVLAIVSFLAYEAALHVVNVRIMRGRADFNSRARANREDVIAALGRRDHVTALFLDTKDAFAVHHAHAGVRAVMYSGGHASIRGELEHWLDWFMPRYPFVDPDSVDEIVERYDADVVVARRDLIEKPEPGSGYDTEGYVLDFENDGYIVYAVESSRREDEAGADGDTASAGVGGRPGSAA